MKIVLVFDGDDTLWMNEWQYSKARADFYQFLYSEFRDMMPNMNSVNQRYNELEQELFNHWGVKRGKISMLMLKVYNGLLDYFEKKFGKECVPDSSKRNEHERIIFEIGDQPFDFRQIKWVESAENVLEDLRSRADYRLCLLTSYDEKVWVDRSVYLGVSRYFENVLAIPRRKTGMDFVEAAGRGAGGDAIFYAVGNGHSDILPALELKKWHGIYIPHGSTSPMFYEHEGNNSYAPPPIDHPNVVTLHSIAELIDFDFENFKHKKSA